MRARVEIKPFTDDASFGVYDIEIHILEKIGKMRFYNLLQYSNNRKLESKIKFKIETISRSGFKI
jgi:hypothetical protein